jgi:hypothetical protein
MSKINLREAEDLLNFIIDNNRKLQDEGQTAVSISFVGTQGIGKTAVVSQVAEKRNMNFVKLSLHELEEVGDLVGYPMKEFQIINKQTKHVTWVAEAMLDSVNKERWNITPKSRMSYAKPAWVPEFNENGTVLLLDDYARSSQMLIQATMELINTGKYMSWSLPKYTTVVLTANPDNGEFNVHSLDDAQKDRFIEFELDFNIDDWARWAEGAGIDSRAINFALSYSNELFRPNNNVTIATPRGYVTFCKAISGIKDWGSELKRILLISKGCFCDKDNAVGKIFTMFINSGYDKLITPQDVFEKTWPVVHKKLTESIWNGDKYNASVASLLSTRIVNWLDTYFDKPGYVSAPVNDRLKELFDNRVFAEDLMFYIIKSVVSKHPKQCAKLVQDPEIISKITL